MDINVYTQHLTERRQHHFGYPYNLDFAFSQYGHLLNHFINNLGDPYIASNYQLDSRQFEQAIIAYFAHLWHFPEDFWGYITSSGTEGNLAALLYGKMSLDNPIVYYSSSTHYSVGKACIAYSLNSVMVPATESGEMNYHELAKMIHPHRDAIVINNPGRL
jgi:histidine decarboxylase